jgi:hypothetical protein
VNIASRVDSSNAPPIIKRDLGHINPRRTTPHCAITFRLYPGQIRPSEGSSSLGTSNLWLWMFTVKTLHPLFHEIPVPVSFCCLGFDSDPIEYSTRVVSVFHNGYVITSPRKLHKGTLISLRMRIAAPNYPSIFWENRSTARVVAEQPMHRGGTAYKVEVDAPLPS